MRPRHTSAIVLGVASAVALGAYLTLLYKSGCTGDLKSGTSGDMQRALMLESYGLPCLLLSILLASASAFVWKKNGTTSRLAFAAFVFVVIGVLAFFAGIQAEIFGNQACL